jgi:hypothetical protein
MIENTVPLSLIGLLSDMIKRLFGQVGVSASFADASLIDARLCRRRTVARLAIIIFHED